jgi:transposase
MLITLCLWPPRGRNRTGSRTAPKPHLTDEQWVMIADLFPHRPVSRKGGRPRVEPRPCLEGILWMLHSGARWKDLPERYPSPSTCWRRLKEWMESGAFARAWARLLGQLDRLKGIDWEQALGDGTFCRAKKGAPRSATARTAKGPRSCS